MNQRTMIQLLNQKRTLSQRLHYHHQVMRVRIAQRMRLAVIHQIMKLKMTEKPLLALKYARSNLISRQTRKQYQVIFKIVY
uniref:Uncharacterized protein n=1 Tax=Salix viminalis TaxID=40686 RepID=A0A6N2K811_SALVM